MQPSLFGPAGARSAIANIDGGSRGNPGPAGYGVRIQLDDQFVELKESLNICTNNVAEYTGLQPLYEAARGLVREIGRVTFEHVRRELNKEADRLANVAMDEAAART